MHTSFTFIAGQNPWEYFILLIYIAISAISIAVSLEWGLRPKNDGNHFHDTLSHLDPIQIYGAKEPSAMMDKGNGTPCASPELGLSFPGGSAILGEWKAASVDADHRSPEFSFTHPPKPLRSVFFVCRDDEIMKFF